MSPPVAATPEKERERGRALFFLIWPKNTVDSRISPATAVTPILRSPFFVPVILHAVTPATPSLGTEAEGKRQRPLSRHWRPFLDPPLRITIIFSANLPFSPPSPPSLFSFSLFLDHGYHLDTGHRKRSLHNVQRPTLVFWEDPRMMVSSHKSVIPASGFTFPSNSVERSCLGCKYGIWINTFEAVVN